MTIDEAIIHCEKEEDRHSKSATHMKKLYGEHVAGYRFHKENEDVDRQLAEWLKDYKRLLEQEPCEDAISRQAVLDLLIENGIYGYEKKIAELPSIQPKPPTGHWITEDRLYPKCDQCGWEYGSDMTNFCPNCGAKMEIER